MFWLKVRSFMKTVFSALKVVLVGVVAIVVVGGFAIWWNGASETDRQNVQDIVTGFGSFAKKK
ncbi:hypothetical protein ACFVUQ_14210 [Streptomyces cyaneofuscatus]|uniref:hypothetical protein n=1 Tax=Streptomyces cyaneofuscatus TaxID=66883 RepID=UPI0036DE551F